MNEGKLVGRLEERGSVGRWVSVEYGCGPPLVFIEAAQRPESGVIRGPAVSNSILGIDDIGVMGLNENVTRLAVAINNPLSADADTG